MAINYAGDVIRRTDGSYIIGNAGNGSARFDGGSAVTWGGPRSDILSDIGRLPGSTGNVAVTGAGTRLDIVGNPARDANGFGEAVGLQIGDRGTGTLNVTSGGSVSVRDQVPGEGGFAAIAVGDNAGAVGRLNVTTGGSMTLSAYDAGLIVGNGGGRGTAVVADARISLLGSQGAFLGVGTDGGSGSLVIQNGFVRLSTGNGVGYDETAFGEVGINVGDSGGAGTIDVRSGTLEIASNNTFAFMNVGRGTFGDPDVAGALASLDIGTAGTVRLVTTGLDDEQSSGGAFMSVGRAGSSGTVTVNGTLELDAARSVAILNVGDGDDGTLRVGATGTVDIAAGGPGRDDGFAELRVGLGRGEGLAVFDGGTLNVESANSEASLVVGRGAGAVGTARFLNGAEVTISGAAANVLVGSAKQDAGVDGTLLVAGGSTITLDATSGSPFDAAVSIGDEPGQTGRMIVTGAGSTVATGAVLVGGNPLDEAPVTGNGLLNVTSGARIVADGLGVGLGGTLNTKGAVLDFLARTADERDLLVEGGTHRVLTGVTTLAGDATYDDGGTLAFQVAPGSNASGRLRLVGEDSAVTFGDGSRIVIEAAGGADFRGGETYALIVQPRDDSAGISFAEAFDVKDSVTVTGQSDGFGYAINGDARGTLLFRALNDGDGARNALLRIGATSNDAATFTYDTNDGSGEGGTGGFLRAFGAVNLDAISGTAGNDVLTATGAGDLDLFGQAGNDRLTGSDGANRLFGQTGDDVLIGNDGADVLNGGGGNDVLFGGTGADVLGGSAGNDRLFGQAGDDRLFGGAGDDVLAGNLGTDVLFGQAGADRFVYSSAAESARGAGDLIVRFERGTDTIDLSAIDGAAAPGDQPLAFVGTGPFTGAGGEVRVVASGVLVDLDGDRGADMVIRTPGAGILAADDFVL